MNGESDVDSSRSEYGGIEGKGEKERNLGVKQALKDRDGFIHDSGDSWQ